MVLHIILYTATLDSLVVELLSVYTFWESKDFFLGPRQNITSKAGFGGLEKSIVVCPVCVGYEAISGFCPLDARSTQPAPVITNKTVSRGVQVEQSVKCMTPGFCSGHGLRVLRSSLTSGSQAQHSVLLSLCLCSFPHFSLTLSLS